MRHLMCQLMCHVIQIKQLLFNVPFDVSFNLLLKVGLNLVSMYIKSEFKCAI